MSGDKTRRILGPFNRVEGDLEVQVEINQGHVSNAWVNSPLYRGFEQILVGKDPRDALVYTPRICGICSVSQSVAAARALAQIQGIDYTDNGRLATNLILACENLADHLSHFYLFFMPDFARASYKNHDWYNTIHTRFAAQQGSASQEALPARAQFLNLTGILAGKWPHSLALQPGGTTRAVEPRERLRLYSLVQNFRQFLERVLFGYGLEEVSAIESMTELKKRATQYPNADFSQFLMLSENLQLDQLGRNSNHFMSYGAYQINPEAHLFKAGTWLTNHAELDTNVISEDISHSWMHAQRTPKHPYQGTTLPDENAENAYSWCKAPRYDGHIMEVGALARQLIDQHPLIQGLVNTSGGNVQNRVIARLLELARIVPIMEDWVKQLEPGQAFCQQATMPAQGQGMGLVEAARGSLGHWLQIKKGRILNYQIVAPTTWNFSPRDQHGVLGPLEQALLDTPVDEDGKDTVNIQHIVRSFDPCMVCTVH